MKMEYDKGREFENKMKGNYISVTSYQTAKTFVLVSYTFIFVLQETN
jgi:hypothetical protein